MPAALAAKLDALPEVGQTVSVTSFVPDDQDAKLAILQDPRTLLGPSLFPATIRPPPSDQQILSTITDFDKDTKALAAQGSASAARLTEALDAVIARGGAGAAALVANLAANAARRLDESAHVARRAKEGDARGSPARRQRGLGHERRPRAHRDISERRRPRQRSAASASLPRSARSRRMRPARRSRSRNWPSRSRMPS